jgi:hypothetical protein
MTATVNFKGIRIEKGEFFNGKQYTVVSSPAPDAFSHPSRYKLTSDQQLGQVGQLIDVDCTMKGLVREKSFTDRATGQQKKFDECDVYFDVYAYRPHVPKDAQK